MISEFSTCEKLQSKPMVIFLVVLIADKKNQLEKILRIYHMLEESFIMMTSL